MEVKEAPQRKELSQDKKDKKDKKRKRSEEGEENMHKTGKGQEKDSGPYIAPDLL